MKKRYLLPLVTAIAGVLVLAAGLPAGDEGRRMLKVGDAGVSVSRDMDCSGDQIKAPGRQRNNSCLDALMSCNRHDLAANGQCTGDRDGDQDKTRDRKKDGTCLEALPASGDRQVVAGGTGAGDRDGEPDQTRDRKMDQTC